MNFGVTIMREEKDNVRWCTRQARGLRLSGINENLARVYLRKSRSALNMLGAAMEKKEYEWILDTSYYAKYFAVYALFMKAGIKCEIHDCTISVLKKLFIEEKIIPYEIYDELCKSKELRVGALYYNKDFGAEQIFLRAEATADFCLKVEEIIQNISEEDIKKVREKFVALQGSS